MRLGIFGGTFDPPHVGHLIAASDAFEHLSLNRLVFVPAAVQPLKVGRSSAASAAHRLAMVRLMMGSDPRFGIDPVEVDREGLSYTVETLRGFRVQFPLAERYFLVGADVLSSFAKWREPREVLALATLAILTRRDDDPPSSSDIEGARPLPQAGATEPAVPDTLAGEVAARSVRVPTRRIDVSSTEIRDRVRCGRPIRGFVTDAVAEYISSHGLYR
ncbi:MAG TPA: nicotinate-nucleotide adenylyltransferase [Gemmatimonadaceae bacterium]|nr:nicotinate-nucleotide adenylyltransferase [Gemmatimonadaceae bacterium]